MTIGEPNTISDNIIASGGEDEFVRLHIAPLDPSLLSIVLTSAILPLARNISYHTLETFPENRYGFLELPKLEAEKLKKKLNGAVLKGCKMKVDKARAEKRHEPNGQDSAVDKKSKKKKAVEDELESPKKRKRTEKVLEGVTLEDRKVKRGWTDATEYKKKTKKDRESKDKDSKRKQPKSKYTDKEECLFKTIVPPNAMGNLPAAAAAAADEDGKHKKKKKRGSEREVTVHEFEKTTKFPSFLKSVATTKEGKDATEFIQGKGWVDENGNVVEEVKEKVKPKRTKKIPIKAPISDVEEESDDDTSSSGSSSSSSDESSSDSESEVEEEERKEEKTVVDKPVAKETKKAKKATVVSKKVHDSSSDSETSDSDSDSSSDSDDDAQGSAESDKRSKTNSISPGRNLTIDIPPPPTTPSAKTVHPLEALYKKNKGPDAAAQTNDADQQPFSFFGGGDAEEDADNDDNGVAITAPMTPFTRQEFEWRSTRSAAPTPDTVHPSRHSFFAEDEADQDMADAVMEEDNMDSAVSGSQPATSDFQKWFWENRGELNRSWMTRRKTAAKEKRHRENKARASKG